MTTLLILSILAISGISSLALFTYKILHHLSIDHNFDELWFEHN